MAPEHTVSATPVSRRDRTRGGSAQPPVPGGIADGMREGLA
jgi:hypothetical protein